MLPGVNLYDRNEIEETRKNLIGRVIYPVYTPTRLFKVVDCYFLEPSEDYFIEERLYADLLDTKGNLHKEQSIITGFNDYQSLIDDHIKKAENHKRKLKEAEKAFSQVEN